MEIIRTIFSLSAEYGFYVHQMDVNTAYIKGDLNDEIYIWNSLQYLK